MAASVKDNRSLGLFPGDPLYTGLEQRINRLEDDYEELKQVVTQLGDLTVGKIRTDTETATTDTAHSVSSPINSESKTDSQSKRWWLIAIVSDLRQLFRMLIDPRFRMRRWAQFAFPLMIGGIVGNYFLFNWLFPIVILSPILERLILFALSVGIYVTLSQELQRYKEAQKQLELWARWRNRPVMTVAGDEPPPTPMEME